MSSLVTWISTVYQFWYWPNHAPSFNISFWSSTVSNIIWSDKYLIKWWVKLGFQRISILPNYVFRVLKKHFFAYIAKRQSFPPENIKVSKQSNHAFTQASKGWHPWKEVYQMMRYRLGSWSLYTRSWYVCTILNFENGLIRHFILLKFPFTTASYKYGRPCKSFTYIQ